MCTETSNDNIKSNYREELIMRLDASHNLLINAIDKFNLDQAIEPITRDELDSFPYMVWVYINENVEIRKKKNRFITFLNFDTRMRKGAEFGEHFHNDLIESTEVKSGKMIDTIDNKIYDIGDVAHFEKGVKHSLVATEDNTFLNVLFK